MRLLFVTSDGMRHGLIACALGLAVTATAATPAAANVPGVSTTRLASRTPDGRFPNGPSQDPAVSWDRKGVANVAYDSDASNIVPGDVNGARDVFVVHRAQPYDPHAAQATVWEPGGTDLVSAAADGGPADGASYLPDLDGDQLHRSHCVAFVSAADNLVPGDNNGQPDAFVRNLDTGETTLVSVNSAGAQADGPTFDVKLDGGCDRVAFTSSADNLALTTHRLPKIRIKGGKRAANPRLPFVTGQPPAGTRQVYVRILGGAPDDKYLTGMTFLASATTRGAPGNGDSYDARLGKLGEACPNACGTTSGDTVAFTSDATNLSPQDNNGASDVYEHTFQRPTQTFVQRNTGVPPYVRPHTFLVSATASGQAGNGPSDQPSINDSGQRVAFRTGATDLVATGDNGVSNVVLANTDTGELTPVSHTSIGNAYGDGPSSTSSISRNGAVLFESWADNISFGPELDRNCVADVLFWNPVNEHLATESADSDDRILGNPQIPDLQPCPDARITPSMHPAVSYYNNFVAFEQSDPLVDLAVADAVYPGLRNDRPRAARMAATDPTLHQVYMHLIGA
jgi:hypothetical protein